MFHGRFGWYRAGIIVIHESQSHANQSLKILSSSLRLEVFFLDGNVHASPDAKAGLLRLYQLTLCAFPLSLCCRGRREGQFSIMWERMSCVLSSSWAPFLCGCWWFGWRCRDDRDRGSFWLLESAHFNQSCAVVSKVMSLVRYLLSPCTLNGCRQRTWLVVDVSVCLLPIFWLVVLVSCPPFCLVDIAELRLEISQIQRSSFCVATFLSCSQYVLPCAKIHVVILPAATKSSALMHCSFVVLWHTAETMVAVGVLAAFRLALWGPQSCLPLARRLGRGVRRRRRRSSRRLQQQYLFRLFSSYRRCVVRSVFFISSVIVHVPEAQKRAEELQSVPQLVSWRRQLLSVAPERCPRALDAVTRLDLDCVFEGAELAEVFDFSFAWQDPDAL